MFPREVYSQRVYRGYDSEATVPFGGYDAVKQLLEMKNINSSGIDSLTEIPVPELSSLLEYHQSSPVFTSFTYCPKVARKFGNRIISLSVNPDFIIKSLDEVIENASQGNNSLFFETSSFNQRWEREKELVWLDSVPPWELSKVCCSKKEDANPYWYMSKC